MVVGRGEGAVSFVANTAEVS